MIDQQLNCPSQQGVKPQRQRSLQLCQLCISLSLSLSPGGVMKAISEACLAGAAASDARSRGIHRRKQSRLKAPRFYRAGIETRCETSSQRQVA